MINNNLLNEEERLIGACILHRHKIAEIKEIVSGKDFENPFYGQFFELAISAVENLDAHIDHITACDLIADTYNLSHEERGEIYETLNWPHLEDNMVHFAKLMKAKSIRRGLPNIIKRLEQDPTSQLIVQEIIESHGKLDDLSGDGQFSEIMPLDKVNIPEWPINAFPEWLQNMITESSRSIEVPIELSAMICLGVLATCTQKKFIVSPKDGYSEPLNFWALVALASGNRKSSILSCLTAPLLKWERIASEALKPEISSVKQKKMILDQKIKAQLKKIQSDNYTEQDELSFRDMQSEFDNIKDPTPPRLWAQDITPEAILKKLHEHDGAFSIISAEGGIFDTIAGRYNSNIPNLDGCLQSHSGDDIYVDRSGAEPLFIENPALTMILAIQPAILKEIAKKPGFRGKGLLARFMYCYPASLLGSRTYDQESIASDVTEQYEENILKLLSIPHQEKPIILSFSKEAVKAWHQFALYLESELKPGGDYMHLADFASKLSGAIARIAGLLHCAIHLNHAITHTIISVETMEKALDIGVVLLKHALRVFDYMGAADENIELAKKVLTWLKGQEAPIITQREVHQKFKHCFKDVNELNPVIKILEAHGYLKVRASDSKPGRPSRLLLINPKIRRQS